MSSTPAAKCLNPITCRSGKKPFQVHRSFLANASDFFRVLLERSFKEAEEEVFTMPEDNPDIIEDFLQWMYTIRHDMIEDYVSEGTIRQAAELARHIHLFVFAEKVQILSLQHRIIDLIHDAIGRAGEFPPSTLRYVYEKPDVVRPLRQILVAYYVWHALIETVIQRDYDYHALRQYPDIAIDYLVFAGLRYGKRKLQSLFRNGPAYFYEVVLHGLRSGGRDSKDNKGDASNDDDDNPRHGSDTVAARAAR